MLSLNFFFSFKFYTKGEIPCEDDQASTKVAYDEVKAILDFKPDRLGHALLLPPSLQTVLKALQIPVESCPTSNVMTLELAKHFSGKLLDGVRRHPQLDDWITNGHPISINTDDPGIFDTDPTKELILLHEAFDDVSIDHLFDIVMKSIDQAFCDDETKDTIKERISNHWR